MKTIEEIRRDNLAVLKRTSGSIRQLAEDSGFSENQISQWINASKDSKTGKPRGMSSSACRKMEESYNLEFGWMDHDHTPSNKKLTKTTEQDQWTSKVMEIMMPLSESDKKLVLGVVIGAVSTLPANVKKTA